MQATQHVSAFSVRPASTPAAEQISQTEITLLLSLRDRLAQLKEQVKSAEKSLRARLTSGAAVEPGDHTAKLSTSYRQSVNWKGVTERLACRSKLDGKAFCAGVLAATRATPNISLKLR